MDATTLASSERTLAASLSTLLSSQSSSVNFSLPQLPPFTKALQTACKLLSASSPTNGGVDANKIDENVSNTIASMQNQINSQYSDLIAAYILTLRNIEQTKFNVAFAAQLALHLKFNMLLSNTRGNYHIPSLTNITLNTLNLSILCDSIYNESKSGKRKPENLEKAAQAMQDSYSKTINDRIEYNPSSNEVERYDENGSKKSGVLVIVNHLFSAYFRLNTLRLCKNIYKPVELRKLHVVGPNICAQITYRYYVGRLCLYEDNYVLGEEHLSFALNKILELQGCSKDGVLVDSQNDPTVIRNTRRILHYLIPLRLLNGIIPSTQLLVKYGLESTYKDIVTGVTTGDIQILERSLTLNQGKFIRLGNFLLLEKSKPLAYRNLLKRLSHIIQKTQINLQIIVTAFEEIDVKVGLDEVECILSNLIYRGFVKGYISHGKRTLVLSKKDAFPKAAFAK